MISIQESFNNQSFHFNIDLDNKFLIIEVDNTAILCSLSFSSQLIQASFSDSVSKPLTVLCSSRAVSKVKKEQGSSDFNILLARLVHKCLFPLLSKKINCDISIELKILRVSNYSIEVLSVLAASLLLSLWQILDSPVSLCKISGDAINFSFSHDSKFRFLGAFSSFSNGLKEEVQNIMIDYSELTKLPFNTLDSYRDLLDKAFKITSSFAQDMNLMQKRILSQVKLSSRFEFDLVKTGSVGLWRRFNANRLSKYIFNSLSSSSLKDFDSWLSYDFIFNSYVRRLVSSRLQKFFFVSQSRLDGRPLVSLASLDLSSASFEQNFIFSDFGYNLLTLGKSKLLSSIFLLDSFTSRKTFWVDYSVFGEEKSHFSHYEFIYLSDFLYRSFKSCLLDENRGLRLSLDQTSYDGSTFLLSLLSSSILLYQNKFISNLLAGVSVSVLQDTGKKQFLFDLSAIEEAFLDCVSCKVVGSSQSLSFFELSSKAGGINYHDFCELLRLSIIKLRYTLKALRSLFIEHFNHTIEKSLVNQDCNAIPSFNNGELHEVTEKFLSEVISIDTKFFQEALVRRDMQISWLAKKLRVNIKIEGPSRLLIVSSSSSKLMDAIKFIRHLVKN